MTQALMDLGPRLDLKPVGGQRDSRGSADSGAAFAEAVDQAVSDTRDRSEVPVRGESGHDDRRISDAKDQHDGGDSGDAEPAADAAATVVWALTPQDLRATQVPAGRNMSADRLDVADVTARSTRRTDAGDSAGHDAAEVGLAHRTAAARATDGAHAAQHKGASAALDGAAAGSTVAAPTDGKAAAGIPKPGSSPDGKAVDGKAATSTAATDTPATPATADTARTATHAGPGAGVATAQLGLQSSAADRPKGGTAIDANHGDSVTAAKGADIKAPAHTSAGPSRPLTADAGVNDAAITSAVTATPDPAHTKASKSTATIGAADATPNSAASSAANSASATTTAAASQVSPTTVHMPTAVAATVNSTPVAVTTPTPTPFANAQPDVANILAQLRGRSDGTYQLRAQVHPAELGAVAITATVHHGALTLTLSPDQAAAQAISQSLPQLRQHLADQGFTGVNVGLGSPDQSGQHGQGGGDRGPRAQGSDHSSLHGPDVAIGAADLASAGRAADSQSALDLML